jgi:hypothetical protein
MQSVLVFSNQIKHLLYVEWNLRVLAKKSVFCIVLPVIKPRSNILQDTSVPVYVKLPFICFVTLYWVGSQ